MKQETLEEAAEKYCLINNIPIDQMIVKNDRSCEFETPVTMFINGAKWQQENSISKEAYEDFLNMQKCSNAGYESKIAELQKTIENFQKMYNEKEVLNFLRNFNKHTLKLQKYKLGNSLDVKDWFEHFKKK